MQYIIMCISVYYGLNLLSFCSISGWLSLHIEGCFEAYTSLNWITSLLNSHPTPDPAVVVYRMLVKFIQVVYAVLCYVICSC